MKAKFFWCNHCQKTFTKSCLEERFFNGKKVFCHEIEKGYLHEVLECKNYGVAQ